jgi:hypothetical protein
MAPPPSAAAARARRTLRRTRPPAWSTARVRSCAGHAARGQWPGSARRPRAGAPARAVLLQNRKPENLIRFPIDAIIGIFYFCSVLATILITIATKAQLDAYLAANPGKSIQLFDDAMVNKDAGLTGWTNAGGDAVFNVSLEDNQNPGTFNTIKADKQMIVLASLGVGGQVNMTVMSYDQSVPTNIRRVDSSSTYIADSTSIPSFQSFSGSKFDFINGQSVVVITNSGSGWDVPACNIHFGATLAQIAADAAANPNTNYGIYGQYSPAHLVPDSDSDGISDSCDTK